MKHYIDNLNKYIIEDEDGNILLSIELLSDDGHQVEIETNSDVYCGPIELLFKE